MPGYNLKSGEVAERSIAAVLKTVGSVNSWVPGFESQSRLQLYEKVHFNDMVFDCFLILIKVFEVDKWFACNILFIIVG